jgi:hypothetical protein
MGRVIGILSRISLPISSQSCAACRLGAGGLKQSVGHSKGVQRNLEVCRQESWIDRISDEFRLAGEEENPPFPLIDVRKRRT